MKKNNNKYGEEGETELELYGSGFSHIVIFLCGIAAFAVAVSLQLLMEYGIINGSFYRVVVEVVFAVSYILLGFRMLCGVYDEIVKGRFFAPEIAISFGTMVLYFIGEYVESTLTVMVFVPLRALYIHKRSEFSLYAKSTADLRADEAERAVSDGTWEIISSDRVKEGDILRVRPGVRFPADGTVEQGETAVSTHSLTGDMCSLDVSPGIEVKAGMTAGESEVIIRASKSSSTSVSGRAFALFEKLSEELRTRSLSAKNVLIVVNITLILSAVLFAVLRHTVADESVYMWIKRAVVLIVISGMCSLHTVLGTAELAGVLAVIKRGIKPGSLDAVRRISENGPETVESSDLMILNDSPKKMQEAASMLNVASSVRVRTAVVILSEKIILFGLAGFGIIGMFPAASLDTVISLLCFMSVESVV